MSQPRLMNSWNACCLSILFLLAGCVPSQSTSQQPTEQQPVVLRIAAASDLKFAFDELEREFQKLHPEISLEPTFGASGTFFAQITQKAPFDLFLSADEKYPQQLFEKGLVRGSLFRYAEGHLVLWVPLSSSLEMEQQRLNVLTEERVKKLAIANPRTAPYGRAAEESLKHEDLWTKLESKIVLGENAAQTTQFAESGNVDAALLPLSHALSRPLQEKGKYWLIPGEFYQKISQAGVILQICQHPEAAEAFQSFLLSPEGREILSSYGLQSGGK